MLQTMTITDIAANKVAELINEEGDTSLCLRVYISGGGCSGFQYGFTFDKQLNEDDIITTKKSVDNSLDIKLVVDSMSYTYLQGATIDFTELEERFVINNPNAKTTCGCGSSFSIEE
jgi:iron-sulfur cluster insertion protein